ncbi:MAG: HAD-IA family hydrolase [Burkholderiaceae bacterium]|nr:HAD-IA family hydrolase [Burkholderiaceae bacterium]
MSEAGRYRLVVFDWDGTLIDSTSAIVHALRAAAADLGLPIPSRERASHVIGLGLFEAIRIAVPSIEREQLPEFVVRYRHHYFALDARLEPFEGIPQLLAELVDVGAWLAVATGKSRAGLDRALGQTGWARHFLTTRCADEGAPKPDPWMLSDICQELDVDPARALMVGDTTHDLGMARAAGAGAIAVTYGAHTRGELEAEPSLAMVDSITELRDTLLARVT